MWLQEARPWGKPQELRYELRSNQILECEVGQISCRATVSAQDAKERTSQTWLSCTLLYPLTTCPALKEITLSEGTDLQQVTEPKVFIFTLTAKLSLPWHYVRRCIQKFPDWVDNEINNNNNKHSFRSNTKGYGGKTR